MHVQLGGTSEVRSVGEAGGDVAGLGHDVDDALLYEVHLGADRALADNVVARLEHLVLQARYDLRHEVGVGVREERNRRHQRAAVEIDYFLPSGKKTATVRLKTVSARSILLNEKVAALTVASGRIAAAPRE